MSNKLLKKVIDKYSFSGAKSFDVVNPATNKSICRLEEKSSEYVEDSILVAKHAQNIFKIFLQAKNRSY